MAPPSAATAAPARRAGRRAASPTPRRAPLRLIPGRSGSRTRQKRGPVDRSRLMTIVAISLVVAALLAVVVGQALLANGQVRLSSLQHQLALEQSAHRQSELAVAQLETPSRIVAAASRQGMVRPPNIVELPYVSLAVPLPTPKVTAAPPVPATTTTTVPAAPATGSSAGTATSGASNVSGASTTTATSTP